MRRHVAQPVNAGGFEADVGIEPARDGVLHDGLPLLLQQPDERFLAVDVAAHLPIGVVQVANDGGLLGTGRQGNRIVLYESLRYPLLTRSTGHCIRPESSKLFESRQTIQKLWGDRRACPQDMKFCRSKPYLCR